jgi:hypothetical protein
MSPSVLLVLATGGTPGLIGVAGPSAVSVAGPGGVDFAHAVPVIGRVLTRPVVSTTSFCRGNAHAVPRTRV